MASNLSAKFDSREMADLAIMRLKRNNVEFTISSLKVDGAGRDRHAGTAGPQNGIFVPSAFGGSFQPFGMNALLSGMHRRQGEAVLKLQVNSRQTERAREIMRSAGAQELREG